MSSPLDVRQATAADLEHIAPLAGELVRLHHQWDPRRFMLVDRVEDGYRRFFSQELEQPEVLLLAARWERQLVGYLYGRLEPRDWNSLLDACGAVHDVYVSQAARGRGIASALMAAAAGWFEQKGAPRVVLKSASANLAGQALFKRLGYRPTMVEMTLELPAGRPVS